MARGEHEEKPKKGGLFDDLSLPQIIAGALAAVTSMLLASQIGIYGSVIGVGVGSVVSAVASQLYKKFLQRSAEKLRELKPGETGFLGARTASLPRGEASEDGVEAVGADPDQTGSLRGSSEAAARAAGRRTATPSLDDAAQQGDATARRVRAKRERKKKVERGVVIVSIVSALLAVFVSGGVVYFATQGQGVGAKTAPIAASQPKVDSPSADEGSSASPSEGEAASSDGSADEAKDQSGAEKSKDASSNGGSSGSGGQQGSGSSGSGGASGSDSGSGGETGSSGSNGSGSSDSSSDGSGSEGSGGNFSDDGSSGSGGAEGSSGSGGSAGSGASTPSGSAAAAGTSSSSAGASASR